MKTETIIYETGATNHAVNDLILFADNTRELVELRDKIYETFHKPSNVLDSIDLKSRFQALYIKAVFLYKKEFPDTDKRYFLPIGSDMSIEFCTLYANDFNNWKSERGYN